MPSEAKSPASITPGTWVANDGTALAAVQFADDSLWIESTAQTWSLFLAPTAAGIGPSETVTAVRVRFLARLETPGSVGHRIGVRTAASGSTTYSQTVTVSSTLWAWYQAEWTDNPYTQAPWTPAEVNSIPRVYFLSPVAGSGGVSTHVDAIEVVTDYGTDEEKSAASTITLGLAAAGDGTKHASTGAALTLDLDNGGDPAKTGGASALIEALLALGSDAEKTGVGTIGIDVLLGAAAEGAKGAASGAGIDLNLVLAGHPDDAPPEHHDAVAEIALSLLMDGIGESERYADALLTLAMVAAGATDGKEVLVSTQLTVVLDAIAQAAKTGGTLAALDLALTIAASVRAEARDITIHIGPASRPSITAGDAIRRTIHPGRTL